MRWRDHFLFCAESLYKEKGNNLNVTVGTCEEMIKKADFPEN